MYVEFYNFVFPGLTKAICSISDGHWQVLQLFQQDSPRITFLRAFLKNESAFGFTWSLLKIWFGSESW